MVNLQQKAHYSLDEFRKGRGSPLSRSEPATPADDNDELSVLGGKTRLVAKQEPPSPTIMDRSPTSHNPVVPLPLSPSMEHPSIWEYLNSFVPNQGQNQNQNLARQTSLSMPPNHNSFSEDVSMYGMSSLPTQPTFQTEPGSYGINHQSPTSPMHSFSHHRQGSHSSQIGGIQTNPSETGSLSFPQYFPVYDYGTGTNPRPMNGNYVNGSNGFTTSPISETSIPHSGRRGSGSPDTNMQSTWQDFVTEMAM